MKLYVTRDRKWLDNWKNDSRYTLGYFIESWVPEFLTARFPEHEIKDYKTEYNMDIQEVYDDTKWFAVIEFDDTLRDETQFMTAIKKLKDMMNITKITKAQAKRSLSKRFTEVEPDKFETVPETIDETTWDVYPAQYLYL